jgi:UDP-3-O-[3-hydroxymyristoyl] glucosamine N-acyltransferase
MQVAFRPEEIAAIVAPLRTAGTTRETIRDIASLRGSEPGDLTFLASAKYRGDVASARASVVLVPPDFAGEPVPDQLFLWVERPSLALARVCARIEQQLWPRPPAGVHPTAVIAADASVDQTATIGPLCVVESGAVVGPRTRLDASVHLGRSALVGPDCWIMPGCVIGASCELQARVRLQPGVVIGSDGFGYEFAGGRHEKVPQIGIVVVESDVEIGANSAVDRARFSRTVIGEGTKIDNLVQVGHNVVIGKHCILCAQVGIAGSTTLEDFVVMGGQAGAAGHLTIAQGTRVGGQAGVTSSTEPKSYLNGTPAISYMLERRLLALHHRLPDLFKRVEILESALKKASASAAQPFGSAQ